MHANLLQRMVARAIALLLEVEILEVEVEVEMQPCASFLLSPAAGQKTVKARDDRQIGRPVQAVVEDIRYAYAWNARTQTTS